MTECEGMSEILARSTVGKVAMLISLLRPLFIKSVLEKEYVSTPNCLAISQNGCSSIFCIMPSIRRLKNFATICFWTLIWSPFLKILMFLEELIMKVSGIITLQTAAGNTLRINSALERCSWVNDISPCNWRISSRSSSSNKDWYDVAVRTGEMIVKEH